MRPDFKLIVQMYMQHTLINRLWRILVILCASYAALFIPLNFIFDIKSGISYFIQDWLITAVFLTDVVVNIKQYKALMKEADFWEVYERANYLKLLILADILAAIPFGIFFNPFYAQFFRMLKLFRVWHFLYQFRMNQIKYANIIVFLFLIFWAIHIIHWLSCGWCLIRGVNTNLDNATNYINALYWTITTLTTVGYGDILPQNNFQKIYAMVVMIMGFGVFGYLIGSFASLLMKKDPAKAKYLENIDNLASLIHYRNIPGKLQKRIVDFYTFMWKQRLGYDETHFLNSLPDNLRTEVAFNLKKEVIETIPLFKDTGNAFYREIALHLKPVFLTPGDYVFKEGDTGKEMYFVVDGELRVLNQQEDKVLTTLKKGDYFGEIALFKDRNRSATVKATGYCDVYVLDKFAFDHVVSKYPEIAANIQKQVDIRENRYSI